MAHFFAAQPFDPFIDLFVDDDRFIDTFFNAQKRDNKLVDGNWDLKLLGLFCSILAVPL